MKPLTILAVLCFLGSAKAGMAEEDINSMTEAEYKNYLMR